MPQGLLCQTFSVCTQAVPPPPPFFGTVHCKGVMAIVSVSAESKGLICTKIVQNLGVLGTAHSKGLSRCELKRVLSH